MNTLMMSIMTATSAPIIKYYNTVQQTGKVIRSIRAKGICVKNALMLGDVRKAKKKSK